jgi:SAM-dependent methyltransferase
MRWAGFDATGLELSPWVVDFSRETFGIPVLAGPVERQSLDPGSLDAIVLMDVLEHLRDPLATLRHCLGLLREDGVLLIQTPCYPEGRSHETMMAAEDRFLECLQPQEHLYLFTPRSLREFFRRLGANHVTFEPPVFPEYDMFPVVSRRPLRPHAAEAVERALIATPGGRLVQALIDLGAERDALGRRYLEAEQDRAARLEALRAHGDRLGVVEAERNTLGAEAAALREALATAEADRAARLKVILQQGEQLRLQRDQIAAQEQQLRVVARQLRMLQNVLAMVERSPVVRLLRRLGYWHRVDAALTPPPGNDVGA